MAKERPIFSPNRRPDVPTVARANNLFVAFRAIFEDHPGGMGPIQAIVIDAKNGLVQSEGKIIKVDIAEVPLVVGEAVTLTRDLNYRFRLIKTDER